VRARRGVRFGGFVLVHEAAKGRCTYNATRGKGTGSEKRRVVKTFYLTLVKTIEFAPQYDLDYPPQSFPPFRLHNHRWMLSLP
jgi:hypothetical protein